MTMTKKSVQVCWTTGNHTQRSELIEKIKKAIGEHDLFKFDEESHLRFVLQQLEQYSCFSDKRLVIIKGWPKIDCTKPTAIKRLLASLTDLADDCVVILNNLKCEAAQFEKTIKKIGKVYHYADSFPFHDACRIVMESFTKKEKEISRDDSNLLVDSISTQFGKKEVPADRLFLLIKKLEHAIGDRKCVQRADVLGISVYDHEFVVWQLFTHIDQKDYISSVNLFKDAISDQQDIRPATENILRTMIWRYRLLLLIKESNSSGASGEGVMTQVQGVSKLQRKKSDQTERSSMGPFTRMEIAGKDGNATPIYARYVIEKAIAPSASYGRTQLLSIYKAIVDALLKIRSTNSHSQIITCFESVLMLACGKLDAKRSEFLREEYRYI